MALTIGQLSAITRKYHMPKLFDNIFDSNALLARIKKSGSYQSVSGGTSMEIPLAFAANSAGGWFDGADTLDTNDSDAFTAASYNWAHSYENITITDADQIKNSGSDAQVVDLVGAKTQWAEASLKDLLGTGLYNDGTTPNAISGLRAAVDSTTNTYGGIDRTTNSWWNPQRDTTTTTLSIPKMTSMYGDCRIDSDAPTVLVSQQDIWDTYHGLLQPQERFQDSSSADGGFKSLLFQGTPYLVDSHSPSGDLWFLNEKYLMLKYHPDKNFSFQPFARPVNQAASFGKIFWSGQFCVSNARLQGVMTAIA